MLAINLDVCWPEVLTAVVLEADGSAAFGCLVGSQGFADSIFRRLALVSCLFLWLSRSDGFWAAKI